MFHFQTSQRFHSDVDPCYLRNKKKKDRSHSGLLLSLHSRAIQKPQSGKKPNAPQTRWLCRAEKAMNRSTVLSRLYFGNPKVCDTGRWAVMPLGAFQALFSFYTSALQDPSGDKMNLPTLQQPLLRCAKETPLKYDGISTASGAWSSVR